MAKLLSKIMIIINNKINQYSTKNKTPRILNIPLLTDCPMPNKYDIQTTINEKKKLSIIN